MTLFAIILGALGTAGISDASEDDEDLLDLLGEGLSFRFTSDKHDYQNAAIYEGNTLISNGSHFHLGTAIVQAIGFALEKTNAWTMEEYRDRAAKTLTSTHPMTSIEDAYRKLDAGADKLDLRNWLGAHYPRWHEGRLE